MFKARNPDQTTYTYRGKRYEIYDAFPSARGANSAAKDIRGASSRDFRYPAGRAITVDLGKNAGRLRYAVFVA